MPKTKNTKKKLSLSTLIFTALLLGALFGVGLHYLIPAGHIRDDIIVEVWRLEIQKHLEKWGSKPYCFTYLPPQWPLPLH